MAGNVGKGRPPKKTRFKPGKSGNPKGRKPEPPELKDFKKWCRTKCTEPDFIELVEKRMKKSDKVLQMVIHYGVGKPVEQIKLEGSLAPNHQVSEMSDEELDSRIAAKVKELKVK